MVRIECVLPFGLAFLGIFIVVYRLRQKPEQIEVLRVLHGAQKWP